MSESARLEDLRRRVQQDPASIAFAQLAEEYRRSGQFEQAVEVSLVGLNVHPGYLSARVTLGRALIQLQRFDEAQRELRAVLDHAPQNLAAIRGLAAIYAHRGELPEAIAQYDMALTLAPNDPELERAIGELTHALERSRHVLDRERARQELAVLEQWLLAVHVTRAQQLS